VVAAGAQQRFMVNIGRAVLVEHGVLSMG